MLQTPTTVVKNPTESKVVFVSKKDLIDLANKYKSISIGTHDRKYLDKFEEQETVGVIVGDLENMNDDNADLWFVNIEYFREHYTIL